MIDRMFDGLFLPAASPSEEPEVLLGENQCVTIHGPERFELSCTHINRQTDIQTRCNNIVSDNTNREMLVLYGDDRNELFGVQGYLVSGLRNTATLRL